MPSNRNRSRAPSFLEGKKPETRARLWQIISGASALLLILAPFGKAGPIGEILGQTGLTLFGWGYWIGVFSLLVGATTGFLWPKAFQKKEIPLAALAFGALLGLLELIAIGQGGGWIGKTLSRLAQAGFGKLGGGLLLATLFLASTLLIFEVSFGILRALRFLLTFVSRILLIFLRLFRRPQERLPIKVIPPAPSPLSPRATDALATLTAPKPETVFERPVKEPILPRPVSASELRRDSWQGFPLSLLEAEEGTPNAGDLERNKVIIQRTLASFGIPVEMSEVKVGPVVSQFSFRPGEGIKLSRITALERDLALALAAHPLRIEAPIPGKSLCGIEIPNRSFRLVRLRNLLAERAFQESAPTLPFALGRDVNGEATFVDLSRLPHLLIAGSTGAGKSVEIHSILLSLLAKRSPSLLAFILIDPKRVELSIYRDVPHLIVPPITEGKRALVALKWLTQEMERRYELLLGVSSRDIASYNAQARASRQAPLPWIVVAIDELADLMAYFGREVEALIVRLSQMARATGIHLIVSTQRPSVEVLTGLIKANITSRIAFQVASQIDSRTILDQAGAEKLLGRGDMLWLAGDASKPRRLQGAYVSEEEVKRVVGFLATKAQALHEKSEVLLPERETLLEGLAKLRRAELFGGEASFDLEDDSLLEDAKKLVIETRKASASFLQRRLRVGYARAARLLDLLEVRGVVGPGEGAKPRQVLVEGKLDTQDGRSRIHAQ